MRQTLNLVVAPAVEVRRDFRRNLPWVVGLLIIIVLYVPTSATVVRIWESQWGFWHACYFTVINMTTVGFGDVVPTTSEGKVIAGINAFAGPLLFGALVVVLTLAFQPAGWSATLTASERTEPRDEAPRPKDEPVEGSVAELLESLASVVRAAGKEKGLEHDVGRVRIHVHGHRPSHAVIEVLLTSA